MKKKIFTTLKNGYMNLFFKIKKFKFYVIKG